MNTYEAFLDRKRVRVEPSGFDVPMSALNPALKDFQAAITQWAIRRGRAALFCDCGLGKGFMQLEWAKHVHAHADKPVLILAPLAVSQQTVREGEKFGIPVTPCRSQADVRDGVNVTNYEMVSHFDPSEFSGIVLDESSILKSFDGPTRKMLTAFGAHMPYRLACSATPAPNDLIELTNHAEFLGVMSGKEIIALYFTQDGNTTHAWRLKGHAKQDFWRWMALWSVAVRMPSDLGFDDREYRLPTLTHHQVEVASDPHATGHLFAREALTLQERRGARMASLEDRVAAAAAIINGTWIRENITSNTGSPTGRASLNAANSGIETTPSASESVPPTMRLRSQITSRKNARENTERAIGSSYAPTPKTDIQENERTSRNTTKNEGESVQTSNVTGISCPSSGSAFKNTTPSFQRREDCAPSVGVPQQQEDSPLIMTTRPVESAVSCARVVIQDSGSSETTGNYYGQQWIIWTNLNAEADAVARAIPGAVNVQGSDSREHKERAAIDFAEGRIRVLVSKVPIFGFGLNLQNCNKVIFLGLSDSFEQMYQGIRRVWRFGQTRPVDVYIVTSEAEGAVVRNIERKEAQAQEMFASIVAHMAGLSLGRAERDEMTYREDVATGDGWTLMLGDSVERLKAVEAESVGLSVFSPPFPGMYAYTNSARDMGNTKTFQEMIAQYRFLIPELLRVTMPGRHCCVHLTQAVAFKGVDGYIGLKDFRGAVIAAMEEAGFVYYGEVCIDKDPQVKAIRTKDRGLLFKTLANDSSHMHMALADYLLQFRKPGDGPPIRAGISEKYANASGWITPEEWIEWAAPVWYRQTKHYPGGISETDVLNVAQARETDDERHLCPLQLGIIERAIKLWSAPGDLVCDPFAGIGSTGYEALRLGRRFVGCELKESYWRSAVTNLRHAETMRGQSTLLDYARGEAVS